MDEELPVIYIHVAKDGHVSGFWDKEEWLEAIRKDGPVEKKPVYQFTITKEEVDNGRRVSGHDSHGPHSRGPVV